MKKECRVWKYEFQLKSVVTISMRKGAEVIHVSQQNRQPCIWAIVDPTNDTEERVFFVQGTGHPIREEASSHLGTWFDNEFVWHLFE